MSANPIKVLQVKGHIAADVNRPAKVECVLNLTNNYVRIGEGLWQVALKDIAIIPMLKPKESLPSKFFQISTNLVQGSFLQTTARTAVPIGQFSYEEGRHKLAPFEPLIWFQINCPSLDFRLIVKSEDLIKECPFNFCVTILLQRLL